MSFAAAALLRTLIKRAGAPHDRILLIDSESTDWHSLTFSGERHRIELRIAGAGSGSAASRMCDGLADAEFNIAGVIVADIAAVGAPVREPDGSTNLVIEALTVTED